MSDFKLVKHQIGTIHRQAKRFSQKLNLPITVAKNVLAKAFYRCSGWRDLEERLKNRTIDRHIQLLTALPQSDEARSYFAGISHDLVKSLSQQMLTNSTLAGLIDLVRLIFDVASDPATLDDLVPTLKAIAWQPAGIGPDPWAVVKSEVVVNGACLILVGTRTYLPMCYDFGPKHKYGEYAEPKDGKLRIIWTEPMAWYRAALDALDDPDAMVVQLPTVELNEAMSQHQAWFEAALESIGDIDEYGTGVNLAPAVLEGGNCYVVFGYPVRTTDEAEQVSFITAELESTSDHFSRVVSLHGSPVCLEWMAYDPKTRRHPGEFDDYFEVLKQAILMVESLPIKPVTLRKDGQPGFFFVRPAIDSDIHQELKVDFTHLLDEVAFVLKTSNLTLCRELLDKVENRGLMVDSSPGRSRYFAHLLVPLAGESPELSFSLATKSHIEKTMTHLVLGCYSKKTKEEWELWFEIDPKLMNLIDIIGKKKLCTATSHGLVQRLPIKFLDELEKPPARCRRIPQLPDEISKAISSLLNRNGYFTMK